MQEKPVQEEKQDHRVRDYLDSLVWDEKPRISRWLIDYAGAEDTPYVRGLSRAMLIAAVRRARQPGCKIDEMVILEGPQGCGKSRALCVLALEDTYADDLPLLGDPRRLIEATHGKWIVEISELNGMESDDLAALKACLSATHDEARMAYQIDCKRVPRQFVIVGTTGATDYLQDSTGNRRLWPVRVQRFDLELLRMDRDQLWAEAARAEARGETIAFADATAM